MARYIYEWKPTEYGRRLFKRPGSSSVTRQDKPAPEPKFDTLKKDELIELADERGIDSSGTKSDIIARLEGESDE